MISRLSGKLILALIVVSTASCGFISADIEAMPYNYKDQCWGEPVVVGDSLFSGCDLAEVIAKDDKGKLWKFPSSCVADGFRGTSSMEREGIGFDLCN